MGQVLVLELISPEFGKGGAYIEFSRYWPVSKISCKFSAELYKAREHYSSDRIVMKSRGEEVLLNTHLFSLQKYLFLIITLNLPSRLSFLFPSPPFLSFHLLSSPFNSFPLPSPHFLSLPLRSSPFTSFPLL